MWLISGGSAPAKKPGASHGWRFDYSYNGKRKTLSLGTYPTLEKADDLAGVLRTQLQAGRIRRVSDASRHSPPSGHPCIR